MSIGFLHVLANLKAESVISNQEIGHLDGASWKRPWVWKSNGTILHHLQKF
ncbi:hypothetical protein DPMN_152878 [Dreissena polymorpha]|uniref:Uncharacterized protein n=1 Tax=Dreissena polymorpha TaxID=45954 RepID=A0A9D4FJ36_DREPO|nr:hypothetical protein DPMN_152878 [Dreissena polymorpha]